MLEEIGRPLITIRDPGTLLLAQRIKRGFVTLPSVRRSSKLGLLVVSVATLSASWIGVGGASPQPAAKVTGTAGQASRTVQAGYDDKQTFCAPQPLSGTVSYRVSSGRASIRAVVRHLPKSALVGVNWANNADRDYVIGTLRSDNRGDSIPGSERLFRPAESRGYDVVLTWPTNIHALATMWPCRSPAAATLQCERTIETRSPITAASLESCLSGQLTVRHLCPPPSNTVFVILRRRTHVLSEGQKPFELPQQYGMGTIMETCGPGSAASNSATSASTALPPAHLVAGGVVVTPATGLSNDQQVTVSVKGFTPTIKFHLSECAAMAQVNDAGCGMQLAAQPFGLTDSNGDGSVTFTVQSMAATIPLSSTLSPCTGQCVVVATTGFAGTYGFAPISFAGSTS